MQIVSFIPIWLELVSWLVVIWTTLVVIIELIRRIYSVYQYTRGKGKKGDDIMVQRKKIPPSSWRIIETIVIRYPERKQEYKTIVEQILNASPHCDGQPKGNNISNQTEGLVLKLNGPRVLRMNAEIDAVGKAFEQMNSESKDLIEKRFWSDGGRSKTPYWCLHNVYMSERTMHRIIQGFFEIVGKEIGEL